MDLVLLAAIARWSVSYRFIHHPLLWLLILAALAALALTVLGVLAVVLLRSGRK